MYLITDDMWKECHQLYVCNTNNKKKKEKKLNQKMKTKQKGTTTKHNTPLQVCEGKALQTEQMV